MKTPMLDLLKRWYPEDDPITRDQAETLITMLGEQLTEKAFEGFVIICSRLVDEFGNHRTSELANVFRTTNPEGQRALVRSLEHINAWVGGIEAYIRLYPVTTKPPNPAFPQLKILGIDTIEPFLYRVMDSNAVVRGTSELTKDYIQRTGRPKSRFRPFRCFRSKPIYHWCTYTTWDTPDATRDALQILPEWQNNCRLRATILTSNVAESAFMAFNGDRYDPKVRHSSRRLSSGMTSLENGPPSGKLTINSWKLPYSFRNAVEGLTFVARHAGR